MSAEFDLKKSKEVVGCLYPVLLDAHGNVIDGIHRLEADPDWPARKLEWVKDQKTLELIRAHANLQRREVPMEERQESFVKLAKSMKESGVKRGKIVTELSKVTGFTDRHLRRLLPDEFKATEHAGPDISPVAAVECELQQLISDLVAGVETQHSYEGKCDGCQIAEKCAQIKKFVRGIWA